MYVNIKHAKSLVATAFEFLFELCVTPPISDIRSTLPGRKKKTNTHHKKNSIYVHIFTGEKNKDWNLVLFFWTDKCYSLINVAVENYNATFLLIRMRLVYRLVGQ